MSFLSRFLGSNVKKEQPNVISEFPPSPSLNTGIHASAKELISLQQVAKKLNLSNGSFAKASTSGSHRSRFRGRGMDYQESRIYQAGDDIRNMDWRVTARSGKPHTKLFQEERERPVILFVDLGPSMFFGSVNVLKSVLACKVATIIAWSVAAKGDRIGALIINETHKELSPKMGKRGVLQLIRELVIHSNPMKGLLAKAHSNNFNEELQRLRCLARPGSLVFLISDFYNINQETKKYLQRLSQHIEIQAIQIIDPLEVSPPKAGRYTITDGSEKSKTGVLNTRSQKGREKYEAFCEEHHQNLKEMLNLYNIPLLQISTADDVTKVLKQNFSTKKSVKKGVA